MFVFKFLSFKVIISYGECLVGDHFAYFNIISNCAWLISFFFFNANPRFLTSIVYSCICEGKQRKVNPQILAFCLWKRNIEDDNL